MKLSVREAQILDLLCHGCTNKTIALRLGISPHTVRDHIGAMSIRFYAKGRTALATAYLLKITLPALRLPVDVNAINPPINRGLHL